MSRPKRAGSSVVERLSRSSKVALAAEILAAYVRVRALMRRHSFNEVVDSLRPDGEPLNAWTRRQEYVQALRLGRATTRTLSFVPLDSRCLRRSLVLLVLLQRRGIHGSLVIGVQPGEEFGAHAWVEYHGEPILPDGNGDFSRLLEVESGTGGQ
jgi:hypothetical protein